MTFFKFLKNEKEKKNFNDEILKILLLDLIILQLSLFLPIDDIYSLKKMINLFIKIFSLGVVWKSRDQVEVPKISHFPGITVER